MIIKEFSHGREKLLQFSLQKSVTFVHHEYWVFGFIVCFLFPHNFDSWRIGRLGNKCFSIIYKNVQNILGCQFLPIMWPAIQGWWLHGINEDYRKDDKI